jgi:phosphoserine phosphatase
MPIELVAFDMDGTLIHVESSWAEIHRHLGTSNRDAVADFLAGRIDDHEFIRTDVRLWWNRQPELTVEEIQRILDGIPLMPGAVELFRALRERGVRTAIVSGGLDLLAERIGRQLRVDEVLANGLLAGAHGRLTGEGVVRVPIKGKEGVLAMLQRQWGVDPSRTASVGNSEFDVGLFRRSRIGVAFLPSDHTVRTAATHVVRHPDLRLLLPILLDEVGAGGRSSLSP